jgi:hypothetical protein
MLPQFCQAQAPPKRLPTLVSSAVVLYFAAHLSCGLRHNCFKMCGEHGVTERVKGGGTQESRPQGARVCTRCPVCVQSEHRPSQLLVVTAARMRAGRPVLGRHRAAAAGPRVAARGRACGGRRGRSGVGASRWRGRRPGSRSTAELAGTWVKGPPRVAAHDLVQYLYGA